MEIGKPVKITDLFAYNGGTYRMNFSTGQCEKVVIVTEVPVSTSPDAFNQVQEVRELLGFDKDLRDTTTTCSAGSVQEQVRCKYFQRSENRGDCANFGVNCECLFREGPFSKTKDDIKRLIMKIDPGQRTSITSRILQRYGINCLSELPSCRVDSFYESLEKEISNACTC